MSKRPILTRHDFLINYLVVPMAWQVGRVTFRPPGWLLRQLRRDIARRGGSAVGEHDLQPLDGWQWSSADITAPIAPGQASPVDDLRDQVRDAIAVLRLYSRECVPNFGLDHQTFGLVGDIGSPVEHHWKTNRRGLVGGGWHRLGVGASWTFTPEWIRTFRTRPAFAALDDALRSGTRSGSLVDRAIVAIRALNYATVMLREPLRIVFQTVALEALLGDEAPLHGQPPLGQAHRVSRRAAFLICPVDGHRLGSVDHACVCLTARSDTQLRRDPRMAARPPDYWDWPCTEYWHIRAIFDARNRTLHEAAQQFPKHTAMRFEGRVDDVILAALDWAISTGGSPGIPELDHAISNMPRAAS